MDTPVPIAEHMQSLCQTRCGSTSQAISTNFAFMPPYNAQYLHGGCTPTPDSICMDGDHDSIGKYNVFLTRTQNETDLNSSFVVDKSFRNDFFHERVKKDNHNRSECMHK